MRPAPSLALVPAVQAQPQIEPSPQLQATPDKVRQAWSPLESALFRLKPACADRNTTGVKLAAAPAALDDLIAQAKALREALV